MSLNTCDIVTTFRESVVELINPALFSKWIGDYKLDVELEGEEIDLETRIEILLKLVKKRALHDTLRKMDRKKIKKLTSKFPCYQGDHISMIKSLSSLFYKSIERNILERRLEYENLKQMDVNDQSMFILRLREIPVPKEVIQHILSYVGFTKWSLSKIGRICKTLYITMLTSWPELTITPRNMYDISLLVLRNTPTVRIDFKFRTSSQIRMFQIPYLLDQLRNLRSLELDIRDTHIAKKLFRMIFERSKSGQFYPFHYVENLEFKTCIIPQKPVIRSKHPNKRRSNINILEKKPICHFTGGFDVNKLFGKVRRLKFPPTGVLDVSLSSSIRSMFFVARDFPLRHESEKDWTFLPEGLRSLQVNCNFVLEEENREYFAIVKAINSIRERCKDISLIVLKESTKMLKAKNYEDFKVNLMMYIHDSVSPINIGGTLDYLGKDKIVYRYYHRRNNEKNFVQKISLRWRKVE